jgi:hypothetical protein
LRYRGTIDGTTAQGNDSGEFCRPHRYAEKHPKGVSMTKTATVEFRDADMRRAWQEAIAAERQAEEHPERIAEQRRRLIRWVEARA